MQKTDDRTDVYARTSLRLRHALGIVGVSFASLGSGPCGPCPGLHHVCYLRKDLEAFRAEYVEAGCESGAAGAAGAPETSGRPSCYDTYFQAIRDWDPRASCPNSAQLVVLDHARLSGTLRTADKGKDTCCRSYDRGCPGGRPFIVDGQICLPELVDEMSNEDSTSLSAALQRVWAEDGRAEYASIASFARLTLQLMAFGAPVRLVQASQQASLDEHRHAQFCFAEAARHAGRRLEPGPLDIGQASASPGFEDFMLLNLMEGCVGETLAGLRMAEQARLAASPELARALAEISADETKHAELAFEILRFGLEANRPATLSAVRRILRMRFEDDIVDGPGSIPEAIWEAHGRLGANARRQVNQDAWNRVLAPIFWALLHDESLRTSTAQRDAEVV